MDAYSLFSGVGGFELGMDRAGIRTVLQAENDRQCLKVLERHWPRTERVTDVRDVKSSGRDGGCDLVYGGFPCQDLSVAGRRVGLEGERSGLWVEFARVLSELRPRWCVIENVHGLLSSARGRDFGIILHALDQLGFDVAWRTLDAQFFGVPQRRRRVFLVGGPRGPGPAAVLALTDRSARDSQASKTEGDKVALTLTASSNASGWKGADHEDYILANPIGGHHRRDDLETSTYIASAVPDLAGTLDGGERGWNDRTEGHGAYILGSNPNPDLYPALTRRDSKGPSSSADSGTPIVMEGRYTRNGRGGPSEIVPALRSQMGGTGKGDSMPLVNGVRRLMPIECERLMGWPDGHTALDAEGNELSDSARYKMCGNGVVAPVAEWIGRRLVRVDQRLGHNPQ